MEKQLILFVLLINSLAEAVRAQEHSMFAPVSSELLLTVWYQVECFTVPQDPDG